MLNVLRHLDVEQPQIVAQLISRLLVAQTKCSAEAISIEQAERQNMNGDRSLQVSIRFSGFQLKQATAFHEASAS